MPLRRFFGKYRGKVAANVDPLQIGRIQVSVPGIFTDDRHPWAMPCVPYAGKGVGFFAIPPIDANVWVEFESGDPDYPIWSGCFWGVNQSPAQPNALPAVKMFKTESHTITLNDTDGAGGLTIAVAPPAVAKPLKLTLDKDGIQILGDANTFIKVTGTTIEIKNGTGSTVTIAANEITLKKDAIELELTSTGIRLLSNPAILKLSTTEGIELTNAPSTVKVSPAGVELNSAAVAAKVTPTALDLTNTAASIKLTPATVNINNGALEVI